MKANCYVRHRPTEHCYSTVEECFTLVPGFQTETIEFLGEHMWVNGFTSLTCLNYFISSGGDLSQ